MSTGGNCVRYVNRLRIVCGMSTGENCVRYVNRWELCAVCQQVRIVCNMLVRVHHEITVKTEILYSTLIGVENVPLWKQIAFDEQLVSTLCTKSDFSFNRPQIGLRYRKIRIRRRRNCLFFNKFIRFHAILIHQLDAFWTMDEQKSKDKHTNMCSYTCGNADILYWYVCKAHS